MARLKFMNTEIDNLTMQETLQAIDSLIQENKNAYVVTPNVDHIVQLETNKELQDVYANASLILTDGKPLLWIASGMELQSRRKFLVPICSHCFVIWQLKEDIECIFSERQRE